MRSPFRAIEPGESLAEILFGLVMALSITLGANLASGSRADLRELLAAALGCNLAWGIIDGVFFLMGRRFERNRAAVLIRALQEQGDAAALAAIRAELEDGIAELVDQPQRERFYAGVLALVRAARPRRRGFATDDLGGALTAGCLVVAAALPAVVPFLLMADAQAALRVSNLVLVVLLFVVGFHWARFAGANPWLAGLGMMALGLVLVATAIALGG
jgi:VIT1/CCC1 family predicted Fe2+/Mn2+ transporter